MEASMVVSSELAYEVVPKRRKQLTQQKGNYFFLKRQWNWRTKGHVLQETCLDGRTQLAWRCCPKAAQDISI